MSADESAAYIIRKERRESGAHKNHKRTKGLIIVLFKKWASLYFTLESLIAATLE